MAIGFKLTVAEKHSLEIQQLLTMSYQLPVYVLWDKFEMCDLKTLSFISQTTTSKYLCYAVKNYISETFKTNQISVKKQTMKITPGNLSSVELYPNDQMMASIRSSIQHVIIYGNDIETFDFVGKNWHSGLTKLTFKDFLHQNISTGPFNRDLATYLKAPLNQIKAVEFIVNNFKGSIFDELLRFCKQITQLTIHSKRIDTDGHFKNKWFYMVFNELVQVHFNEGVNSKKEEFKQFIALNSSIRILKFTKYIELAIDFIDDANLYLDMLILKIESKDVFAICNRLNELYLKNRFKKLSLIVNKRLLINHIHHIATLPAPKSITLNGSYTPHISQIQNVYELSVDSFEWSLCEDDICRLQHLERLHIERASFADIGPLVSECQNLKQISINKLHPYSYKSFNDLVNNRIIVRATEPLEIYLEQSAYIALKREYREVAVIRSMVDRTIILKRIESLDLD